MGYEIEVTEAEVVHPDGPAVGRAPGVGSPLWLPGCGVIVDHSHRSCPSTRRHQQRRAHARRCRTAPQESAPADC